MKFLAYYDTPENGAENRGYVMASTNKIDYICSALNRIGHSVEIVSLSATANRKGCKGKTVQVAEETTLKLFPCLGNGNRVKRTFRRVLLKSKVFLYLLFHLKKNEVLFAYHSLGCIGILSLLKKLKKFKLVLEVEEIYADVSEKQRERKKEFQVFSIADAYIFPAHLLNEKINTKHKPYAISHGTYQVEPEREAKASDKTDMIHCVYAGTFDPRKGGAQAAVSAAEYLSENYYVHILGFGTKTDEEEIKQEIRRIAENGVCKITYDGLLKGEEYIRFIQSCHIGLNTHNPAGAFNDTSFPSKILSYMANGLRVVSARIPVVEQSGIHSSMYYYTEHTPEAIAKAVMQVDMQKDYDGRAVIRKLDEKFVEELKSLLDR